MNDAELVKSKLDIVEVISGYVELKKAGKDYKGVSPFRQERTPSFFVSPEKQIWHDFGANEGGDLISFIMQIEGMSFPEALTLLADRAGVKLQKQSRQNDAGKPQLFAAVQQAMKYFHLNLSKSPTALDYIKQQRGLTAETIRRFVVGYAPDGWTGLADYLKKAGYKESELVAAGLCGKRDHQNGVYDLFRDRIVFPVFDAQSRPIGFSGRILTDVAKSAKYINTPDCVIYHKAQAIFGYEQAKQAIRTQKRALIVEGHLDVLSLSQHGQQNVVALSGTAMALDQLKQLARMADVIQLCFDQDAAGRKATVRAIELAAELEVRVEVVSFSGAKDPDELIQKDPAAWEAALKQAEYAWDYMLRQVSEQYPPDISSNKKPFVRAMLPVFNMIKDKVEKEHYLSQVAARAGVEPEVIRDLIRPQKVVEKTTKTSAQSSDQPPVVKLSRAEQLEAPLLEMMLAHPASRVALQDLNVTELTDINRDMFKLLIDRPKVTLDELAKILPDQLERAKILSLRGEHEYSAMTEHEIGLEAFTQVHTVQKHIATNKKRALTRDIAQAEQAGDFVQAGELLKRYQQLVNDDALY